MTIYEVNIALEPAIEIAYRKWLAPHVREILKLDGFIDASLFNRENENGKVCLTVHYRAKNRAAVDLYLEKHAAKFRKEASDRFGNQFSANRRILEEEELLGLG